LCLAQCDRGREGLRNGLPPDLSCQPVKRTVSRVALFSA
jgi:hypothetical protein